MPSLHPRFTYADFRRREYDDDHYLLLCEFALPPEKKELERFPTWELEDTLYKEMSYCLWGDCENPTCRERRKVPWEIAVPTTLHLIERIIKKRDLFLWAEMQELVAYNNMIEHLLQPPQVVHKKQIIEHVMEPQVIKNVVEEHVHIPDPVVVQEHRTVMHYGRGVRQRSTTVQYRESGESSRHVGGKSTKYLKEKSGRSRYDSDDSMGDSKMGKGKGKRRDDDEYSDDRKDYAGKGKGKRRDDDYNEHISSHHENYESKRSSTRTRCDDDNDRSSRNKHSAKPYSRSRSHSRDPHGSLRRRSFHRNSSKKDNRKQPNNKHSESSNRREIQSYTHRSEDEDAYYGSDTNQSERKVPSSSSRWIKDAPKPSQESPKSRKQGKNPEAFDPYEALGLQNKREKADQIEIEAAYKGLIRKWHPDRLQKSKDDQEKATKQAAEINRAKDILGNPRRRAVYDRTGKTEIWELDELAEQEAENSMALVRPGQTKETKKKGTNGLKNFFEQK